MSRRLLISNATHDDLIAIWRWTCEQFGERQADRYLDELGVVMNACADSPERGRDCSEIRDGYRSVLVGRHVVFYQFDDAQLIVQRVLHGSMDFDAHLEGGERS